MRSTLFIIAVLLFASCGRSVEIEKEVRPVIGLQPLGGFDKGLMDTISGTLKSIYGFNVVLLENSELPAHAFVQIKSPRYRADSLLRYLLKIKPDTIDYIMGLTSQDISTTKRDRNGRMLQPESKYLDWGIFGLGFRPGKSCVISTYRIYDNDQAKFINRLTKVCVHEFGHNLGLSHCQNDQCVMQDAEETIKTVDSENLKLCISCKARI
jgi:archaemetzincin